MPVTEYRYVKKVWGRTPCKVSKVHLVPGVEARGTAGTCEDVFGLVKNTYSSPTSCPVPFQRKKERRCQRLSA